MVSDYENTTRENEQGDIYNRFVWVGHSWPTGLGNAWSVTAALNARGRPRMSEQHKLCVTLTIIHVKR